MSGLDFLLHPDNLTAATYCDTFPCGLGVAESTTMLTDYVLAIELFVPSPEVEPAAPRQEAAGNNPYKANGDAAKFPL